MGGDAACRRPPCPAPHLLPQLLLHMLAVLRRRLPALQQALAPRHDGRAALRDGRRLRDGKRAPQTSIAATAVLRLLRNEEGQRWRPETMRHASLLDGSRAPPPGARRSHQEAQALRPHLVHVDDLERALPLGRLGRRPRRRPRLPLLQTGSAQGSAQLTACCALAYLAPVQKHHRPHCTSRVLAVGSPVVHLHCVPRPRKPPIC